MQTSNTSPASEVQTKAARTTSKQDFFVTLKAIWSAADNGLDSQDRAVLTVYLLHDGDNGGAWPSNNTVARRSGCSTSRTRKAIAYVAGRSGKRQGKVPKLAHPMLTLVGKSEHDTCVYRVCHEAILSAGKERPVSLPQGAFSAGSRPRKGHPSARGSTPVGCSDVSPATAPAEEESQTPASARGCSIRAGGGALLEQGGVLQYGTKLPLRTTPLELLREIPEKIQSAASSFPDGARTRDPGVEPGQHAGSLNSNSREAGERGNVADQEHDDREATPSASWPTAPVPNDPDTPSGAEARPRTGGGAPLATSPGYGGEAATLHLPSAAVAGAGSPGHRALDTNTDAQPEALPGLADAFARDLTQELGPDPEAVARPARSGGNTPRPTRDDLSPLELSIHDKLLAFERVLGPVASAKFARRLGKLVVAGRPEALVLGGIVSAVGEIERRRNLDAADRAAVVERHAQSAPEPPMAESDLGEGGVALLGALRVSYPESATPELAGELDRARLATKPPRSIAAAVSAVRAAAAKGKGVCVIKGFVRNAFEPEPGPETALETDDERAALEAWRGAVADAGKPPPARLFPEDVGGIRGLERHARRFAERASSTPSHSRPNFFKTGRFADGRPAWPPKESLRGPDEDESFAATLTHLAKDFVARAGDDVRPRHLNPRPTKHDWQDQLGWVPPLEYGLGDDRRRDDLAPGERARLALENLSGVRTVGEAAEALTWLLEGAVPYFAPRGEVEAERDRAAAAATSDPLAPWQESELWARRRSNPRTAGRTGGAPTEWGELELKHGDSLNKIADETPTFSGRERAVVATIGAALGAVLEKRVVRLWAEALGADGSLDGATVLTTRRQALGGFLTGTWGAATCDGRWTYTVHARAFFLGRRTKELGLKTRAFDADVRAEPLPYDEAGLDEAGRGALETMREASLWFATPARAARLAGILGGAPAHLLAWACRRAGGDSDALDAELERLLDLHESGVVFGAPEGPPPPEYTPRANPDRPQRVPPRLFAAPGPVPIAAEVRARLAHLAPTQRAEPLPEPESASPVPRSPATSATEVPAASGRPPGDLGALVAATAARAPHLAALGESTLAAILGLFEGSEFGSLRITEAVDRAALAAPTESAVPKRKIALMNALEQVAEEARAERCQRWLGPSLLDETSEEAEQNEEARRWLEADADEAPVNDVTKRADAVDVSSSDADAEPGGPASPSPGAEIDARPEAVPPPRGRFVSAVYLTSGEELDAHKAAEALATS